MSAAGKRAGIKAGTRSGLWAVFADAIDALRPQYVVVENVRGLLSARAHRHLESDDTTMGDRSDRPVLRALGAVLGDLSDLGYDARWATVAAASVGAPHRRERVFILATDAGNDGRPREADNPRGGQSHVAGSVVRGQPGGCGTAAASGAVSAVSGDEPGVALLPTPCVVDRLATGEMTLEEWDESRRSQKERGVGSFGPRGDSLGAAILRVEEGTERPDYSTTKARRGGDELGVALLPTPSTHDKTGARSPQSIAKMDKPFANLNDTVVTLLPTPSLSDNKTPRRGAQLADTINNNTHTINLSDAVEYQHGRDALLCTPSASDGAGGKTSRSGGRIDEPLLPTPKAHDGEFGTPRTTGRPIEKSTHLGTIASLEKTSHWGKYAPAIARWEQIVGPAPAPTEPNKNGNPRLSAAFSEWLMGWPAGWVTDPDIGISRNDQLRILGNGVVVQQAIAALRYLLVTQELEFA